MIIATCQECGKVCLASPSGHCPACSRRLWDSEQKVAKYLEDNQNSTLEEIHRVTGIQRHAIMQMIRKGSVSKGRVLYPCEHCKELIRSGRLCASCAGQVMKLFETCESAPAM